MHLDQSMHSHIGCTCLTFLHCVFSNVSSNGLPEWLRSHTDCICLIFLHCVFSNVFSKHLHKKMQSHTGCICKTLLLCVSSDVSSNYLHERKHDYTGCSLLISPHYLSLLLEPLHWPCLRCCFVQDLGPSPHVDSEGSGM